MSVLPGIGGLGGRVSASASDAHVISLAATYDCSEDDSGPTSSSFSLSNTGGILINGVSIAEWITPLDSFGAYQVKFHKESGTTPAGASMDTWLDLDTTRTITVTDNVFGGGPITAQITATIRRKVDTTELDATDTGGITLSATRSA